MGRWSGHASVRPREGLNADEDGVDGYSVRRVWAGSVLAARRAGMKPARAEAAARVKTATSKTV